MNIDDDGLWAIQDAVAQGRYIFSVHAASEAIEDEIDVVLLERAIPSSATEVLEDYPEDRRGHSCLLLTFVEGQPVHVVCSRSHLVVIITVYKPDPARWREHRERL